jgi:hypothetical protein
METLSEDELKEKYFNHRLYILVNEEYPPSVVINSSVHGGMGALNAWKGEEEFDGWFKACYKKVTCVVNEKELANIRKVLAKTGLKELVQTEGRLNGAHILTMIYPFDTTIHDYKAFRFLRLYK